MTYQGNTPIAGLTSKQAAACEAAARHAPDPAWHDGIMRNIATALGDAPPFADLTVKAAIRQVLADLGLDDPLNLED
jgi:hypothetical protein